VEFGGSAGKVDQRASGFRSGVQDPLHDRPFHPLSPQR
jgi:hypothetical protein